MSSTKDSFDPIGVVVDWLDACRERQLPVLIDLYDDAAIIDCCQGGTFRAGCSAWNGIGVQSWRTL